MILKVARLGHPIVRGGSQALTHAELAEPRTQDFIDGMIETMREYAGVGLAATQVHAARRIAVIEVRGDHPRYPEAPAIPLTVLVNPEIVERSPEMAEDWEGCLSVPDLRGLVPRHRGLRVRALDREGGRLDFAAEGFFARVIQHEVDHLEGAVYLDRMNDLKTLSFLTEFGRYWAKENSG